MTEDADWEVVATALGGELVNRELADTGEYETYLRIPMVALHKRFHVTPEPQCRFCPPPDPRCTVDVGSRPGWMSPDQYDPCRCTLPKDHDGAHACAHTLAKADK